MRTPPLLADFSHARACKPFCENSLTLPNPAIRAKFDSMPPELREHILQMDVKLETMSDLMACLERIVAEGERST